MRRAAEAAKASSDDPASHDPTMRIFVAGATGVLGIRLLPLLVEAGHTVAGMTRSPGKAALLRAHRAAPVVCDVYDAAAVADEIGRFGPDLILHELTDLPDDVAQLPSQRDANARIRVEGTRNLIDAAQACGCDRMLAQSVAWELPPGRGSEAVATLERQVLDFGGVVVRYGQFYGPGTFHPEQPPSGPRVHIDSAARLTARALDAPTGIITITDEASIT